MSDCARQETVAERRLEIGNEILQHAGLNFFCFNFCCNFRLNLLVDRRLLNCRFGRWRWHRRRSGFDFGFDFGCGRGFDLGCDFGNLRLGYNRDFDRGWGNCNRSSRN